MIPNREQATRDIAQALEELRTELARGYEPARLLTMFTFLKERFDAIESRAAALTCEECAAICRKVPVSQSESDALRANKVLHDRVQGLRTIVFKLMLGSRGTQLLVASNPAVVNQPTSKVVALAKPGTTTPVPLNHPKQLLAIASDAVNRAISSGTEIPNDEVWNKVAKAIEELQSNSVAAKGMREVLDQLLDRIEADLSKNFGELVEDLVEQTGKSWSTATGSLRVCGDVIAKSLEILRVYSERQDDTSLKHQVQAKYVGAFFFLEIPLGKMLELDEEKLAGFYDAIAGKPGLAYQEFTQKADGLIYYVVCLETKVPSFRANEVTILGRKVLLPCNDSIRFSEDEKGTAGAIPLTTRDLFGMGDDHANTSSARVLIQMHDQRFALPVEGWIRESARYFPKTKERERLRRLGYAGTSELEDGSSALIWDLSVAVERWYRRLDKIAD